MTPERIGRAVLWHGDCRDVLPRLEVDSIDACVTDPPYHLTSVSRAGSPRRNDPSTPHGRTRLGDDRGFMGKTWDGGDIAFRHETWAAVLRVLKPGAHLLCFGGTRTWHRLVCAIEDAGFEIRDTVAWLYGSGFPKSHNLDDEWQGWGTALKPAFEPIILARKPLAGTVAANVAGHGTGALNIDGCRIGLGGGSTTPSGMDRLNAANAAAGYRPASYQKGIPPAPEAKGRWPANVCHDGSPEVMEAFARFGDRKSVSGAIAKATADGARPSPAFGAHTRAYGARQVEHPDKVGTAARFFYSAKADDADRLGSRHPTVKPVALMRWLVRLVTPPGGTVLDPFAGSGTTGQAALAEGFGAVLIEREAEYVADIRRRLGHLSGTDLPLLTTKS